MRLTCVRTWYVSAVRSDMCVRMCKTANVGRYVALRRRQQCWRFRMYIYVYNGREIVVVAFVTLCSNIAVGVDRGVEK